VPSHSFTRLSDRALIRVGGPEAQHFLQNLVTADIDGLGQAGASAGALLTPQGKILFDFLIYKTGDGYLMDTPAATAPEFLKRLTFYRLRAKVELELLGEDIGVLAVLDTDVKVPGALVSTLDPRLAARSACGLLAPSRSSRKRSAVRTPAWGPIMRTGSVSVRRKVCWISTIPTSFPMTPISISLAGSLLQKAVMWARMWCRVFSTAAGRARASCRSKAKRLCPARALT